MKAGQIVDAILAHSDIGHRLEKTCDVYASGGPDTPVNGIVTTFMATAGVIKKAIELNANMIVTHEPTFFTGWDSTEWLAEDSVYLAKKKLIEENNIVIWRYHDHMHMKKPDAIYEGLIEELGWQELRAETEDKPQGTGPKDFNAFISGFRDMWDIPETTLAELAVFFKEKLQMDVIQLVGDPSMKVGRVGILVGGGSLGLGREEMPMQIMERHHIDVMVCGEITEWTLCSYVNDAVNLGFNKALIIAGHERTEEWGMKHMAQWLKPLVPGLPVHFADAGEPFVYL